MINTFKKFTLAAFCMAGASGFTAAGAQVAFPSFNSAPEGPATAPQSVSAAEAEHHVWMKQELLNEAISFRDPHYPLDSLRRVVKSTAVDWSKSFKTTPLSGLQHDAASRINIAAGQEDRADALIAERLAMRGMRVRDKAFTLATAVDELADFYRPERLPKAEEYLRQLDALGDSAAFWQIQARSFLQTAYYHLGRSADVARLGITAMQRLKVLPYRDQEPEELDAMYLYTVEAVSSQPDGRAKIDAMNAILRSTYDPPPALLAVDTALVHVADNRKDGWEYKIKIGARIGTQGAPLMSNYWGNRPSTDSAVIPVNDGKIRLIEVFSYGCDGCLFALHGIQRIQERFPKEVQGIATTFTFGYWANRPVSPEDEAQKLGNYFANELKVTYPVAIWKWAKVQHEDGGVRMASNVSGVDPKTGTTWEAEDVWRTPNGINYPLAAKPTTYVLDGKGRIRRIFLGGGREIEADMLRTVEFLLREAQQSSPPSQVSFAPTGAPHAAHPGAAE